MLGPLCTASIRLRFKRVLMKSLALDHFPVSYPIICDSIMEFDEAHLEKEEKNS